MKDAAFSRFLAGALLAGAAFSLPAWAADLVVIVNKSNANAVDKAFVVKVYVGEVKNWPDGGPVFALDQGEDNPIRLDFNGSVLGKSSANMKALWAQNIFAGKGLPPKVADSDAEVKKVVSTNKNAIGYIKASSADDTVKVVVK
ncbi:MAG: substrate-binding domain-containing protein [Burkholderiales bacterium]